MIINIAGFSLLTLLAIAGFVWIGWAAGWREALKVIAFAITFTVLVVLGAYMATYSGE